MRKRVLCLVVGLCLITSFAFAEKYYVYIDNMGGMEKGQEASHNEIGDIIEVVPCTPQYKPTPTELGGFRIFIIDLTDEERKTLTERGENRPQDKKVILEELKSIKQEQKIDKENLFQNIIVKPSLISSS